jgi:hypothetical protein
MSAAERRATMRRPIFPTALIVLLASGCATAPPRAAETTLGRVVVYKSGVAYFERSATIDDDVLRLAVPAAELDDFLKSLTVVDAKTGAAAPVAFPHASPSASGLVDLEIQLSGPRPHALKLSYITEAPAWKPTYRAVLRGDGKVGFEGWAIVDNESSEDWKQVKLGVGSSSALSFRFDLRSPRNVARMELTASDRFAAAPPMGESPYGAQTADGSTVLGELDDPTPSAPKREPRLQDAPDVAVARMENGKASVDKQVAAARTQKDAVKVLCLSDKASQLEALVRSARERRSAIEGAVDPETAAHDRAALAVLKQRGDQLLAESQQCVGQEAGFVAETSVVAQVEPSLPPDDGDIVTQWAKRRREAASSSADRAQAHPGRERSPAPAPSRPPPPAVPRDLRSIAEQVKAQSGAVTIEGYARPNDADPKAVALERAASARDELVRLGVPAERLHVAARGSVTSGPVVRFVRTPAGAADRASGRETAERALAEPIGASHFEAPAPLSIAHGASAMISIVKAETTGEVVYLYDAESQRGNATFPFRSVRLSNPTDSTLESGPVTVFGDGRFVGEGLCEPIPAKSVGFVPFALDRQVIADARITESDGAPRLLAADGEALTTEVLRTRRTQVTLHSRLAEPTVVYVRHTVPVGYELRRAPAERERAGGAHLFKVVVPPLGAAEVAIEEVNDVVSTTEIGSPEGIDAVRAFVASAAAGSARDQLGAMVKLADEAGALRQRAVSVNARLDEQRRRADQLRARVASLRAGRASAPLLAPLDRKLEELDREVSRSMLELVGLDERLAVVRVRVTDAAHGLRLDAKVGGGGGAVRSR